MTGSSTERAVLMLILARGGSKGVPRKNLVAVGGMSLLARAVRRARLARDVLGAGRVVVDTDDDEIAAEARAWGAEVPYRRPAHLAGDQVGSLDVVRHAISVLGLRHDDAVVLLQPTSPLVPASHVVDAVRRWRATGSPVVSVTRAHPHPAWCYRMSADQVLAPWTDAAAAVRRQDLPEAWAPSGAVYVASVHELASGRGFLGEGTLGLPLDPALAIDIDEPADVVAASALAAVAEKPVHIGDRVIATGHPCFVIAEAGVNHDGDIAIAHELVDAAADAGADAIKFQTWQTHLLVKPGARAAEYQTHQTSESDQYEMLRRLELPYDAHAGVQEHARKRGLVFLSTPDEMTSARFLAGLGVPALKIGSAELDNLPYLAQVAALSLPILLSTGMSTLNEVANAVDCIAANGNAPLALFHTVSAYPAPAASMNVRAIRTLRDAFGVPVGLSDHFPGPEAMLAAVGIGLPIWEKHFTLDRRRTGPDHSASVEPDELQRQIQMLRTAELTLGDGRKRLAASEEDTRATVRKRLHAARDLTSGERLQADDLVALRATTGIPVAEWSVVVGARLREAIAAGEPIEQDALGD